MLTSFLGVDSGYDRASVVIVPGPFDGTTTYMPGARWGPRAILDASQELGLYDREAGCEVADKIGIHTLDLLALRDSSCEMISEVRKKVSTVLGDGKMPFLLGGDHSLTLGAAQAAFDQFRDLQVVQLDAHADLRDEYHGNRFNHACVARRIQEFCPVLQAGIRSLCQEEADFILQSDRTVTGFREDLNNSDWWPDKLRKLDGRPVYLTIDVDVLDPAIMPSTGTPEPGGLTWLEVVQMIRELAKACPLVGADCMELAPTPGLHGPNFAAAKLVYKTIALSMPVSGR